MQMQMYMYRSRTIVGQPGTGNDQSIPINSAPKVDNFFVYMFGLVFKIFIQEHFFYLFSLATQLKHLRTILEI